ncbi:MAG: Asp-tRNA(Asn)/Glu-tRNA(Gln) amidotransferase GatCAB subunit B, partial [Candidatus Sumerlaeia bacterium]|nr:Asp-tRNA(Asn)/Glu-tRNA(Gln) amidotransferase GatCAB subunit B [Candidatus Sumerlaeia bacterium]
MRAKFSGPCIPDPAVPPIVITPEWLEKLRARLPEMPLQKKARFITQYKLTEEEAELMSAERDVAEYFESVVKNNVFPRIAAQWIATRLLPALKERQQEICSSPVTPSRLAELLAMLEREEINTKTAREILLQMFESDKSPVEIVTDKGIKQIADVEELEKILEHIINANPEAVANLRQGKKQAASFLIGQAMQASQGKANPRVLAELLAKKLNIN